ncbi:MAG: hypothetical protein LKI42_01065 [Bacteroidales bacterium]|jgi:hypothetical protein|nr:hypothetical protein [Bacteroidales bacterium]MCI1784892.1 hypothetical protein [Bacteroidales bacterium]
MQIKEKNVNVYETPRVEDLEVAGTSSLLAGSTAPDAVYTDGGDGWGA